MDIGEIEEIIHIEPLEMPQPAEAPVEEPDLVPA